MLHSLLTHEVDSVLRTERFQIIRKIYNLFRLPSGHINHKRCVNEIQIHLLIKKCLAELVILNQQINDQSPIQNEIDFDEAKKQHQRDLLVNKYLFTFNGNKENAFKEHLDYCKVK